MFASPKFISTSMRDSPKAGARLRKPTCRDEQATIQELSLACHPRTASERPANENAQYILRNVNRPGSSLLHPLFLFFSACPLHFYPRLYAFHLGFGALRECDNREIGRMRLSTSLSALGLAACALAAPDVTTTDENGIRSIPVCLQYPHWKNIC